MFRYSSLDTAHRCLQRYKFQWIDKLSTPGLPSIDLEFGTAMHLGIQGILEKGDGLDDFDLYWNSLGDTRFSHGRFDFGYLGRIGRTLLIRFDKLHAKNYETFKLEEKVACKIGEYDFEGTPDFIGLYKGKRSIVDFKTSAKAYEKDTVKYKEQLYIYAHMAKVAYGYDVEQIVYQVFTKQDVTIQTIVLPVDQTSIDKVVQNVILLCQDLTTRDKWIKNPNSCMMGSHKCPFFSKCHGDK